MLCGRRPLAGMGMIRVVFEMHEGMTISVAIALESILYCFDQNVFRSLDYSRRGGARSGVEGIVVECVLRCLRYGLDITGIDVVQSVRVCDLYVSRTEKYVCGMNGQMKLIGVRRSWQRLVAVAVAVAGASGPSPFCTFASLHYLRTSCPSTASTTTLHPRVLTNCFGQRSSSMDGEYHVSDGRTALDSPAFACSSSLTTPELHFPSGSEYKDWLGSNMLVEVVVKSVESSTRLIPSAACTRSVSWSQSIAGVANATSHPTPLYLAHQGLLQGGLCTAEVSTSSMSIHQLPR